MDLNNKLKGLPKIYYFNLDERLDRREYTEEQYEKYKIKDFIRYSTSKYQYHNFEEWKDKLILNDVQSSSRPHLHIIECSMTLSYLEFFKNWLETSDEKYILIMEDDYDLSYIDYWHFDWEYLMNNIPFDWDCIQLGFETEDKLPCFLSPTLLDYGMGPALLHRKYVEKIIRVTTTDGKFDLTKRISNYRLTQLGGHSSLQGNKWRHPNMSFDHIMSHCGKTYCLPLIVQSNTIGSYAHDVIREGDFPALFFTNKAVRVWWKVLRDKFSLEDFFMYGKPNDFYLTPQNINQFKYIADEMENNSMIINRSSSLKNTSYE